MMSSTDNDLPPTNNNPEEAAPYLWRDDWQPPSPDTLQLWVEVGNKLDEENTGKFCAWVWICSWLAILWSIISSSLLLR